ncbi:hypothetical protein OHA72_51780 [Dactylosporangium sp. NBC_01737]|uniref:hypothetical protein n=1 Tax=Dactylosporangium sp. NBC_01737 TaxID=2975959 RepID=UPI002E0EC40D|nr:hypothetical protein OHA72_51780 [Dactylosporangium sp. NBC_01737]
MIPELLTFDEADARLDGGLSACFQGHYESVLFFAGDATFDSDLCRPSRRSRRGRSTSSRSPVT